MSIAKVIEITAASPQSFEDAIRRGVAHAAESVHNIQGAWVKEQKVVITDNQVAEWRVDLKISFILDE